MVPTPPSLKHPPHTGKKKHPGNMREGIKRSEGEQVRQLESALFTSREIKCRGNLVNWKMSQIATRSPLTSSPQPLRLFLTDNSFYLLKYVFVFLCQYECVCVREREIW